jgi:serine/threonine protein kinase
MISETISHYRILSKLGAGGMGEVYLAEDTRLGRKVALKRLPDDLLADEQARRRFAQEAKTTSALNHSHIVTIYDIASDDHHDFIAMEYVEGESLGARLMHEKLSVKQAVEFAAQAASGLAAAHSAGIIHRDIKPENLMVTRASQIKILDFGLAKLVERQRGAFAASDVTTAYLGVANETKAGAILGTVAYMSPEQARAEKLDQRTDIFSLGVVLYEMVTGERPFRGKSAIDTLHAIINVEPLPVTQLNPELPPELTDILAKALAKDPAERYQHAGDFELDLRRFKRALETNSLISEREKFLPTTQLKRAPTLWFIGGALVLLSVAALAWALGRSSAPSKHSVNLESVTLTPLTTDPSYEGEPTFSPDGETIAYVSDRSGNIEIYMQQISGGPYKNITNNNADDAQPAYSPDGKQIAFVSTRSSSSALIYRGPGTPLMGGDVWVMPALGGSARRIAEAGNFPSWTPDGSAIIYVVGRQGTPKILSVPASGGTPREIPIKLKAGEPSLTYLFYPSYSSDGRWIVFEGQPGDGIYVVSAAGGEAQRVAKGKRPVWNAGSNAIIYSNAESGRNYSLWQVPVSLAEGKVAGSAQPLTVSRGRDTQPAVSRDGKLIAFAAQDISFNIEAIPFDAETGRLLGAPQEITKGNNINYFFSVSPDGLSVVYEAFRGAAYHIWKVDRGSDPVQLTSDPNFEDRYQKWSPDGRIAFVRKEISKPGGTSSLWQMAADGANPQQLLEVKIPGFITWAPDGRGIVYFSADDKQLYLFDLATKSTQPITHEPGVRTFQNFSPDGKWLVFLSTRSGTDDIRAIPMAGGESRAIMETPHEDGHPFVSPSGRWLYFQFDHKNIYRVPGPAQNWRHGEPEKITNFPESNLYVEDPQISRDGRQLFYSHGHITGDIWIMSLGK